MGSSGSGGSDSSSGGGGVRGQAVAEEENMRNLRRVRRPNVRLQHSYLYEERPKFIPREKHQKQKEPIKKGDKTGRQVKFAVGQSSKNFTVNCTNNEKENEEEEESENEMSNDEDDINETIGNLRTVKKKARTKRNRPSSSNHGASEKSLEKINETQVQENDENVELSSDGESENEEEENSNNDDDDVDEDGDNGGDRGSGGGHGSSPPTRRRRRVVKERDGNGGDGVRAWLDELGLGKYAKLFEAHEVDEETLPLLTMDDLIDMGISAIGSRRKMYTSIQKVGKGMR